MNEQQTDAQLAKIHETLLSISLEIAKIRAAVNALKIVVADDINRNHPEKALKLFQRLEEKILSADLQAQESHQAIEQIDALKLWKEFGGGQHEA